MPASDRPRLARNVYAIRGAGSLKLTGAPITKGVQPPDRVTQEVAIPAKKKRAEERTGHRTKAELEVVSNGQMMPVQWPRAPKGWQTTTKRLYDSAKKSGYAHWYQQTDIEQLRFNLEQVDLQLKSGRPMSAMMLQVVNALLSDLGFSESARRKANIELQHPEDNREEDAQVTHIAEYRDGLSGPAKQVG